MQKRNPRLYIYIMNWEEKIHKKINQLKAGASGLGSTTEQAIGKWENKFGAFFMPRCEEPCGRYRRSDRNEQSFAF